MELFTDAHRAQLLANGRESAAANDADKLYDPVPVVKLFTPDAGATWLLSELDPYAEGDDDLAFGLCDLGLGFPELGYVRVSEIEGLRGKLGLPVERDQHVTLDKPLSHYADEARRARRITV